MQEPTLPAGLEDASLGLLIGAARRRAKQVIWRWLEPYGLTPQQLWIILVLHESGPYSLHELAERIWADDPTACRVVRTLSDRGLLSSGPDPDHGRRRLIRLAEPGLAIAPELAEMARCFREGLQSGLGPRELERFRLSLGRVIHNLDRLETQRPVPEPATAELP